MDCVHFDQFRLYSTYTRFSVRPYSKQDATVCRGEYLLTIWLTNNIQLKCLASLRKFFFPIASFLTAPPQLYTSFACASHTWARRLFPAIVKRRTTASSGSHRLQERLTPPWAQWQWITHATYGRLVSSASSWGILGVECVRCVAGHRWKKLLPVAHIQYVVAGVIWSCTVRTGRSWRRYQPLIGGIGCAVTDCALCTRTHSYIWHFSNLYLFTI